MGSTGWIAMKHLLLILLLATPAFADTKSDCNNILNAFGELQISAKQAKLADQLQGAVAQVCMRLQAEEEKPKATPTPEPTSDTIPVEEPAK